MTDERDTTLFSLAVRTKAGVLPKAPLSPQEIARAERAEIVKATYKIEDLGPGLYYVQHPIEDERAYMVDVAAGSCDCPDYQCRGKHELFRCKHLLAIQDITGCVLPQDTRKEEAQTLDRTFSRAVAEIEEADDPYARDERTYEERLRDSGIPEDVIKQRVTSYKGPKG